MRYAARGFLPEEFFQELFLNPFLEEFEELQASIQEGDEVGIKEEVGDLLLAALNISRLVQVDPETALARANRKFSERFKAMERHFTSQGRNLREIPIDEMDLF